MDLIFSHSLVYRQLVNRYVDLRMGVFKSAKQIVCSPNDWTWLVFTYGSNQSCQIARRAN